MRSHSVALIAAMQRDDLVMVLPLSLSELLALRLAKTYPAFSFADREQRFSDCNKLHGRSKSPFIPDEFLPMVACVSEKSLNCYDEAGGVA